MIQISDSTCFAVEALSQSGTIGNMVGKNLDGDDSAEARIAGAINLAHPTRTNGREDFVGAQVLADGNCHWLLPITNWATI
jgi:hypothetical protein